MSDFRLDRSTKTSPVLKGAAVVFGLIVVGLVALAVFGHDSDSSSSPPAVAEAKANVFVVASQSFCAPTGVDDAYTGDGHVTFFLTFRNSGKADGDLSAIPVRHYDDGSVNESALDAVTVTIPAGKTMKFHTEAMTYKAHSHEITDCGVVAGGSGEVPLAVR